MFPLCHIYFATKVMNSPCDFALLGCIYPDVVVSRALGRNITHYNTHSLYEYCKTINNDMKEFAVGAITHGVDMKGLDYYSDESYPGGYKGYCFEKAKAIEQDVIESCNLPEEWGLWKAHNFIEMGFELYLNGKYSNLKDKFKRILENRNLIEHVCVSLEIFYNISRDTFRDSFNKFIDFFEFDNLNSFSMVRRYGIQLKMKHGIDSIDMDKAAAALDKAVDIVEHDGENFFMYTVPRVKGIVDRLHV